MKSRGYELVESKMFNELDEKSKLNNIEKGVSYLNRFFVFNRTINSLCKQESNYLMECDWPLNVKDLKKDRLLRKYKKALDNKIMKANANAKIDYIFIRDNFEKGMGIWGDESISETVRNYYKKVYDMFLVDLSK
jgi:ABC-type uncharacterized transport system auxiliary subunit